MQMERNETRANKALPEAFDSFWDKVGLCWTACWALPLLFLSSPFPPPPPPCSLCSRMCHIPSHSRAFAHTAPSASAPLLHPTWHSPLHLCNGCGSFLAQVLLWELPAGHVEDTAYISILGRGTLINVIEKPYYRVSWPGSCGFLGPPETFSSSHLYLTQAGPAFFVIWFYRSVSLPHST